MGKNKQKSIKIFHYWKDDDLVFSDHHVNKVFEAYYTNQIEPLEGVKVFFNTEESDTRQYRGTIEFHVDGYQLFMMYHDTTIYVSATVYQLREILDQCGGCRTKKRKIVDVDVLGLKEELEADKEKASRAKYEEYIASI